MRRQHTMTFLQPRASLALAILTLAVSACHKEGIEGTHPDFRVSDTALSFEACPTQDEQGNPIADVFPAQQTFSIENLGKASGNLTISIEGNGKDRFQVVPSTLVGSIESGTTTDIAIQFTPTTSGDATASLVIEDGDDTTAPVRVALQGSGINLPAQPTIQVSYELSGTSEFTQCMENFNGQIDNCLVTFPDTFLDQSAQVKLKVKNLGCPTLKITDLSLTPFNPTDVVQFFIDQPAVLPTQSAPATLNLVDGTPEMDVVVRFEPKNDGTSDGQRYAYLTIKSNAQKSPESLLTVFGYAAQPAIYATPSFCDFTNPNDTCGGTKTPTTGATTRATFKIINGGNSPVAIDSVAFRGTASGRFVIAGTNPVGTTIDPGASAPLQIDYTDAPIYVTDLIDVTASSSGQPAGIATVRVSGGVLPKLSTVPDKQLDFSDATTSPATKPVQICNGDGAGTLVIKRLQITQNAPVFKVKSAPAAGTEVAAGQCVTANIEFTRPVTGGFQAATLDIESNDPAYSPYRLTLYSDVPADLVPVAVIEGPNGEATGFSVSLTSLDPKTITLHAENSYDPSGTGSTPVSQYQFYLGKAPTGATAASITAPGTTTSIDGVKQTSAQVDLNVDPNILGEYQVWLTVYDAAGQASSSVKMSVFVKQ